MWHIVFVLIGIACVHAQSTPPDYRYLQISVNQNQLFILANQQNGSMQDQYMFMLNIGQQNQKIAHMDFQYQAQNGPNQTQIQFNLDIIAILEYNATSDDNIFTANDTFVSRYPPTNQVVQWQPFVNESVVVGGVPVYIFAVTSQDGVFTIRVHIAPQPVGLLGPNDVKIDFEIHEFPFEGEQTRLALWTELQSQSQFQNNGQNSINNNNFQISGSPNLPLGSFSWVPKAGNNSDINVVASTANEAYGNQFDLYFSFLTPPQNIHSDIVWDPTIGLAYASGSSNEFCFILCGSLGIVMVVVVVVVVLALFGTIVGCILVGKKDYQRIAD